MEVWLLRHAHAPWGSGHADPDRPIDGEGEREADALGAWMKREGLRPDWIAVSSAERALQTLARVRGDDWPEAVEDDRVYDAGVHDLLRVLEDAPPDAGRVLVVGHNPGLEMLARTLAPTVATPVDGNLMPPCTLLRIQADGLRRGEGTVVDAQRARGLF